MERYPATTLTPEDSLKTLNIYKINYSLWFFFSQLLITKKHRHFFFALQLPVFHHTTMNRNLVIINLTYSACKFLDVQAFKE